MLHVSDARSNASEQIEHVVLVLGKSAQRLLVFDAIYRGKKKIKTVNEISIETKLPAKRVLTEGKLLADNQIVKQLRSFGITAYEKDPFFSANKQKILRLVQNPKLLERHPTKRRPIAIGSVFATIKLPRNIIRTKFITIDDVDSFNRVKTTNRNAFQSRISEDNFKKGIAEIIGEQGIYRDWGGEKNDLWTSRLRIRGKRYLSAFGFKGPGTKGVLTPKKMGKNGDQIQRLFSSRAEVYIVQYWGVIGDSIVEQMAEFAKAKSATESTTIFYGIVDGKDTSRLIAAYPNAFKR
jgi:hypothetical protein